MTYRIPDAVLAQHLAVLGKTGSGKTSTEKLAVEQVVAAGFRVCVLDTIKSDWWGITSSADGKKPGLPFKILGGPHGHVPLHPSAGKALGQIVGSGKLPLSIIDMADFEAGGLQKFFVDFAPALMRSAKGVIYLVIEEAHELAPKERAGFGQENLSIHWAKKLATAGRSKGIRLIVASQRVQSLHNAVLGSCETMITHRLTAPADQEPILKWLKANTDKDTQAKVYESLSSLPTGTGWICSGEAKIFEQRAFPKFKTYDNAATPESDSDHIEVKSAPVDQDELRSIIGDAVKEAEENDPKILKAKIAELTRKIASDGQKVAQIAPDPKALKQAEKVGFDRGYSSANAEIKKDLDRVDDAFRSATEAFREVHSAVLNATAGHQLRSNPIGNVFELPDPPTVKPKAYERSKPVLANLNGSGLKPALQTVLNAIAWWRKIGVEPVRRERACVVAGYSPKASTFGVYVADLVKQGLVEVTPGHVQLTAEGLELAVVPFGTTAEELRGVARGLLKPQEQRVFDAVYDAYPGPIARADVAEAVDLSPTASTVGVYLAGVAAYGMIEPSGPGKVRAAEWLFP